MKRYNVPRIAFINKLDRMGAKPIEIISQLKTKLKLNAAAVQLPIGLEEDHQGVVDLITMTGHYFSGKNGSDVTSCPADKLPEPLRFQASAYRMKLIEAIANVDNEVADYYLLEEDPPQHILKVLLFSCHICRKQ